MFQALTFSPKTGYFFKIRSELLKTNLFDNSEVIDFFCPLICYCEQSTLWRSGFAFFAVKADNVWPGSVRWLILHKEYWKSVRASLRPAEGAKHLQICSWMSYSVDFLWLHKLHEFLKVRGGCSPTRISTVWSKLQATYR